MISNYWEEQVMSKKILDFHEEELKKFSLLDWVNIKCPFCGSKLPLRSIRSITMKLNTRNMGDLALEFICDDCYKMDTLYFRKEINSVTDFAKLVNNLVQPKSESVLEEVMLKQGYNNVVEKMVGGSDDTLQKSNIEG